MREEKHPPGMTVIPFEGKPLKGGKTAEIKQKRKVKENKQICHKTGTCNNTTKTTDNVNFNISLNVS